MDIVREIRILARALEQQKLVLTTAESCTGGLISHLLTNEPGSSGWYWGGVVAYTNALKVSLLKVDPDILRSHGAVSSQCVTAMALGAAGLTEAQVSLAVSGIAGPGGGTGEKPVGTVYLAWHFAGRTWWEKNLFKGNRKEVKMQAAARAIQELAQVLKTQEDQNDV